MLIKQRDDATGGLRAGRSKRSLSKLCTFITHHEAVGMRECAIGMLTAGMSSRAVARELSVYLQRRFPENLAVDPTGTQTPDRRPCVVTTSTADLHIRILHLQDETSGLDS